MIDKRVASAAEAVSDIFDGATIMFGGFGEAGSPIELIHALIDQGATNLTMISNNCGSGEVGLAALLKAGRVSKVVCSFPRTANSTVFPELYRSGRTKLELVPQGTLAERIRAGGAGIPAFYTPSAVGTPLAEGKECREFGGRQYVLEHARALPKRAHEIGIGSSGNARGAHPRRRSWNPGVLHAVRGGNATGGRQGIPGIRRQKVFA